MIRVITLMVIDVSYKESNVTQWSKVVSGRRKIRSHTRHIKSKPTPYATGMKCSTIVTLVNMQTQTQWEVTHWLETAKFSQRQNKKIIIGDSHGQGIATEI